MAKKLKEKILKNANNEFVCKIIMDYDDSGEGYYIEIYDTLTSSETTSFGPGDKAKSKCELLFKALSNYCDKCYKKSNGDIDLFWDLIDEEFESGWLLADEDGGIYTSLEKLDEFLKFTSKWENRTIINSSKELESMTQEELTDYLLVNQDKELLAWICDTPSHTFDYMTIETQKAFLFRTLKDFNRLSIYFKIHEMFIGLETDMAYFITNVKNDINRSRRITDDVKRQAQYLQFKLSCDDSDAYWFGNRDEPYYSISGEKLLDKERRELDTTSSDVNKPRRVEITNYFNDKIGKYITDNRDYFDYDIYYSWSVKMPLNF